MHPSYHVLLAMAGLVARTLAEDVLFPHMQGLKYSEYDEVKQLGLTGKHNYMFQIHQRAS